MGVGSFRGGVWALGTLFSGHAHVSAGMEGGRRLVLMRHLLSFHSDSDDAVSGWKWSNSSKRKTVCKNVVQWPFLLINVNFIAFTRVSPPTTGCHPAPFLPVRPRSPLLFVNSAIIFFSFGCHSPKGCHPGRCAPFPATPSDTTVANCVIILKIG